MKVSFNEFWGIEYTTSRYNSKFALWINGVCYGVFSRVRDAMRKYRSLETICMTGSSFVYDPWDKPAWIETVDTGKLVKAIVGEFSYAN